MLKNKAKAKAKEEEKEKENFFYPSLVGSEVSGAELGRADYDPIPRNYNWVNKRGYTNFLYQSPAFYDQNHYPVTLL